MSSSYENKYMDMISLPVHKFTTSLLDLWRTIIGQQYENKSYEDVDLEE